MITNLNVAPVERVAKNKNEQIFMSQEEWDAMYPNAKITPMRVVMDKCPSCGAEESFITGKIRSNVVHGKQEQMRCVECGQRVYRKLMSAAEYCASIGVEYVKQDQPEELGAEG